MKAPAEIRNATIPPHTPGDWVTWIIPFQVDLFEFGIEVTVKAADLVDPEQAWAQALEKVKRALQASWDGDIRVVPMRSEPYNRRRALINYLRERRERR